MEGPARGGQPVSKTGMGRHSVGVRFLGHLPHTQVGSGAFLILKQAT